MITHKHSLLEIIAAVAHADGVRPEDICGGGRDWGRMCGRFVVIYMAREDGRSLSEIGRAVGRDHTTILSAVRRVDQYRERNDRPLAAAEDVRRHREDHDNETRVGKTSEAGHETGPEGEQQEEGAARRAHPGLAVTGRSRGTRAT